MSRPMLTTKTELTRALLAVWRDYQSPDLDWPMTEIEKELRWDLVEPEKELLVVARACYELSPQLLAQMIEDALEELAIYVISKPQAAEDWLALEREIEGGPLNE